MSLNLNFPPKTATIVVKRNGYIKKNHWVHKSLLITAWRESYLICFNRFLESNLNTFWIWRDSEEIIILSTYNFLKLALNNLGFKCFHFVLKILLALFLDARRKCMWGRAEEFKCRLDIDTNLWRQPLAVLW